MTTLTLTRRTVRNGGIGLAVGLVVGVVPILGLFAPLLAGSVAGYLERAGARAGAIAGAVAGVLLAVVGSVLGVAILLANGTLPGELPPGPGLGLPIGGLAIAAALWLVGATGGTIVAALGGAFGGVLEADVRARSVRVGDAAGGEPGERSRTRTILVAVGSLLVGGVTFVVVALGVTAALDPYVWPSALLGLPAGAIGGVGVAVLAFHLLTRRTARGRSDGVQPQ